MTRAFRSRGSCGAPATSRASSRRASVDVAAEARARGPFDEQLAVEDAQRRIARRSVETLDAPDRARRRRRSARRRVARCARRRTTCGSSRAAAASRRRRRCSATPYVGGVRGALQIAVGEHIARAVEQRRRRSRSRSGRRANARAPSSRASGAGRARDEHADEHPEDRVELGEREQELLLHDVREHGRAERDRRSDRVHASRATRAQARARAARRRAGRPARRRRA